MLVGELPKPAGLRDKLSQSPGASACCLRPVAIAPGPYFPASEGIWTVFSQKKSFFY